MRSFVRVVGLTIFGGGLSAAAIAMLAEPFFQELYRKFEIDTSAWVFPMLNFLSSGFGYILIGTSIGFGLGMIVHWLASRFDRENNGDKIYPARLRFLIDRDTGQADQIVTENIYNVITHP